MSASSRRSLEVALQGILVGIAALVVWIAVKEPAARSAAPPPPPRSAGFNALREAEPVLRPVDPGQIRDVFRFADDPAGPARERAGPRALADGPAAKPAPTPLEPRLVGLVRRAGGLLAALAADGDVVLAGPGDTVGGVTVLSVGEEGVRVRRADGREEILLLP